MGLSVDVSFHKLPETLAQLLAAIDPHLFQQMRWFGHKDAEIRKISLVDFAQFPIQENGGAGIPAILRFDMVQPAGKRVMADYYVPLALILSPKFPEYTMMPGSDGCLLTVQGASYTAHLREAAGDLAFVREYVSLLEREIDLPGREGIFQFRRVPGHTVMLDAGRECDFRPVQGEFSNSLFIQAHQLVHKTIRHLAVGVSPELDINLALQASGRFHNMAPILGHITYKSKKHEEFTLLMVQEFIENQGDAWGFVTRLAAEYYAGFRQSATGKPAEILDALEKAARDMGNIIAELHAALAGVTSGQFTPEPVRRFDIAGWVSIVGHRLEESAGVYSDDRAIQQDLRTVQERARDYLNDFRDLLRVVADDVPLGMQIRIHGDLHLGQLIRTQSGFYVLDFEGEPMLPHDQRRRKRSPLVDVAGMLRSFSYASYSALPGDGAPGERMMGSRSAIESARLSLEAAMSRAFLDAYIGKISVLSPRLLPISRQWTKRLLGLFVLGKALYEIVYESKNRPAWLHIPVRGALDCLESRTGGAALYDWQWGSYGYNSYE